VIEHLQSVADRGIPVPQLDLPEPGPLAYVYDIFGAVGAARQGGFGPSPLAWAEIEAWSRLYGARLLPYELTALRAIDAAFLDEHAQHARKKRSPSAARH
jgi:hypothetical protein